MKQWALFGIGLVGCALIVFQSSVWMEIVGGLLAGVCAGRLLWRAEPMTKPGMDSGSED
jgi:hypothetical protein